MKASIYRLLTGIGLFLSCLSLHAQNLQTPPDNIPGIRIRDGVSGDITLLKLSTLSVTVNIIGNLAVTSLDMTFYNGLSRPLEGNLTFPLAEGQTVSGFAMDFEGILRQGVVVEKNKGQKVFEAISRRRVDPALLQWTAGNNFRARVFPIPANGTKRLVISYEQELDYKDDALIYKIPLDYGMALDHFSINFKIEGASAKPYGDKGEWRDLKFLNSAQSWQAGISRNNYTPPAQYNLYIPAAISQNHVYVDKGRTENIPYFLINEYRPVESLAKSVPSTVSIYWDISSSAVKRDIEKDKEFLFAYLERKEIKKANLIFFSNEIDTVLHFDIGNCNTEALKLAVNNVVYDGGTQLGCLDFSAFPADEILLFTDAVSNFGKHEIKLTSTPVYCINSSLTAAHEYLNYIALKSGGLYLNLTLKTIPEALELINGQGLSFISATYDTNQIREFYPAHAVPCAGRMSFSGILSAPSASITLNYGYGGRITKTSVYTLYADSASDKGMLERVWVQKKITELQMDYQKRDEEITSVGKKYSVVTKNTSLIVLESLNDYLTYEIVPPPEMQDAYFKAMALKEQKVKAGEEEIVSHILMDYQNKVDWWNQEISKEIRDGSYLRQHTTTRDINEIAVAMDSSETIVEETRVFASESPVVMDAPMMQENVEGHVLREEQIPATDGLLSGIVIDANTKEPIPFANLFCQACGTGTTTDFDGKFNLRIPPGSVINVTYVGYKPIAFNAGNLGAVEVALESQLMELQTLEVTCYKLPLIDRDATTSYIRSSDLNSSRNVSGEFISTVPGVFSNEDSAFMYNIRGSRGGDNAVYVDGVRVRSDTHLPTASIESITVYTGGVPARYGDLTGGVIDITTRSFRSFDRYSYDNFLFSPSGKYEKGEKIIPPPWRDEFSKSKNIYFTYLRLKEKYADNPAFYRDVSDMLLDNGDRRLSIKVLSNLAELDIENHELMRVLARRLSQIGELDYAIDQFQDILKLRAEEPHSYRDLGLAYAEKGEFNKSIEMLNEVLMGDWDTRFPGINSIVLGEMNNIIALAGDKADTSLINPRLIRPLPCDIRIVLNWDCDNTDMDLWVTEPTGEKCFYGFQRTKAGGYLSNDFTRGYGPEEYLLKKAIKGNYKIQLNYYGNSRTDNKKSVTLQVQVFTKYGSPDQKKREFTLLLGDNSQVVDVGTLNFKGE
jgi:tetratricopeptide (TPR) repeat protein